MKKKIFSFALFSLAIIASISACSTPPLEKAFKESSARQDSNKIIGEYCTSCHVHKEFKALEHLQKAQRNYNDRVYSSATECRICHTYKKTWLLDVRRGTHWPAASSDN